MEIRRSDDHLISTMGFPTLVRWHLYIESDLSSYQLTNRLTNSSLPGAAYMRQWTGSALVQIMACRLFGAKPLSEPMLKYCQLDLTNKLQWNSNRNTKFFIQENAFENVVCEMAAILSRGDDLLPSTVTVAAVVSSRSMSTWFQKLAARPTNMVDCGKSSSENRKK